MSQRGKAGISTRDRQRSEVVRARGKAGDAAGDAGTGKGCRCGCKGGAQRSAEAVEVARSAVTPVAPSAGRAAKPVPSINRGPTISPGRAASMARRRALSSRGKAGIGVNGMTAAQTARAANPKLSGRQLAQALRAQRSKRGSAGEKRSEPVGRRRQRKARSADSGGAADAYWKVGVTETSRGQPVTGTVVGHSAKTTGDDQGVCRTVTGTEYMGADIFREFCHTDPTPPPPKVHVTTTAHGKPVSGTEVGRSPKVTGDEPGTCQRVTGTEYLSTEQLQSFCGTAPERPPVKVTVSHTARGKPVTGSNIGRSPAVTGNEPGAARELTGTQVMEPGNGEYPPKVGVTQTVRGRAVTGTVVGRSPKVTGDEPGACRTITGDEYVGAEQYEQFCGIHPEPQDAKVGVSETLRGRRVSGTMTTPSPKVTGDEPGLCKAITGTPYAGAEQYRDYCGLEDAAVAQSRVPAGRATPGPVLTGAQPGLNGKMTGAEKGACEPLTGTPYVGADQYAESCPSTPAAPGSPDFPQPLGKAPWGQFSVTPPAHAATHAGAPAGVTGTRYEKGRITGPFGKAAGKVTGTEEFRFGRGAQDRAASVPPTASRVDGRVKPRVSGEGMDAGPRITGDDWDRGDRVTGTEGTSAIRRNPTQRGGRVGGVSAMPPRKRNEQVPEPVSKVTGASGSTEKGAIVTYSGGARG